MNISTIKQLKHFYSALFSAFTFFARKKRQKKVAALPIRGCFSKSYIMRYAFVSFPWTTPRLSSRPSPIHCFYFTFQRHKHKWQYVFLVRRSQNCQGIDVVGHCEVSYHTKQTLGKHVWYSLFTKQIRLQQSQKNSRDSPHKLIVIVGFNNVFVFIVLFFPYGSNTESMKYPLLGVWIVKYPPCTARELLPQQNQKITKCDRFWEFTFFKLPFRNLWSP